jgi:hypothetical protein
MRRVAVAVVVWCAVASPGPVDRASAAPAQAPPRAPERTEDSILARLAQAVRARLTEAAAARGAVLVAPVPVAPRWAPQKLGSIDLGAPLVAIAAADLDRDGKAELYLVTTREVIALGIAQRPIRELGRVAFTGEPAVPASRDPVGTAVVEGGQLIAASSPWARELRVAWQGKVLVGAPGLPGFRLCDDQVALIPGRNQFRLGSDAVFGARCPSDLTDRAGYPLRIRAQLALTGALEVAVARCAADASDCRAAESYTIKDVGFAFELADIDRDGTPELIASSASAPGDDDAIRVISLGGKPLFKRVFHGGVAGIAVADCDGNGTAEVIAAIRLPGATRVDLWRLN